VQSRGEGGEAGTEGSRAAEGKRKRRRRRRRARKREGEGYARAG